MFHANAWGLAHAAVAAGASLIMPGPDLSPPSLAALIEEEKVTIAAGVPTIWMGVLPELQGRDTSALRAIPCGGSAVPQALSEAYREQTGLPILQAWGMTETSPIASVGPIKSTLDAELDDDGRADLRTTVGQPSVCVTARIAVPTERGEPIEELPWDGESSGELQVSGPWIAREYYDDPRSPESFTDDGWLKTGDVATIDRHGYIRLVDRTKDVIKSGGEWISSVDLENELMGHPAVAEAAVIGVPPQKWAGAAAGLRRGQGRASRSPRRSCSPTSRGGWPSGGSPTTSSSSTRCRRPRWASSPRRTCARSSRVTRCPPTPDRRSVQHASEGRHHGEDGGYGPRLGRRRLRRTPPPIRLQSGADNRRI